MAGSYLRLVVTLLQELLLIGNKDRLDKGLCSIGSKHTASVMYLRVTWEENSNSQGSLKNLEHQLKIQSCQLRGCDALPGNDPTKPVREINP